MKDALFRLISPVRKRVREELPPRDISAFLCLVAREAARQVRAAKTANGTLTPFLNNFLRTPIEFRHIIPETPEGAALHAEVLEASNWVGRESWDILVNHIIMERLDRRERG